MVFVEIVYRSSESIKRPSMSKSAARMRGGGVLLRRVSMHACTVAQREHERILGGSHILVSGNARYVCILLAEVAIGALRVSSRNALNC